MMGLIFFILCSNFLIYPNVAIKNHQYQSSLTQDSYEDDLSDLYGRDDDYSDILGNICYLIDYKNKSTMLSICKKSSLLISS